VHPARACGSRRADDDLARGPLECRTDRGAQIGGARELLPVAEDGVEPLRYGAARGGRADQLLRRTIGLERLVQPRPPPRVAMAIAEEGPVLGAVQGPQSLW